MFYYSGLPSSPRLVARTSTTQWEQAELYRKVRELRVVGSHTLTKIWEGDLALRLHALLDSIDVQWTSTDVVHLGSCGEPSAPVIIWIGVVPKSLSGSDGVIVAAKCRELLVEVNAVDVEVEIRESIATLLAGPKLLSPLDDPYDTTLKAREPLTPALGLPICAQSTPWVEGRGGSFFTEGENDKRHFLATNRHIVFPPDQDNNQHYQCNKNDQPCHLIRLFGDVAFTKYTKSMETDIAN